jgi:signal transduction histidine kinase
MLSPLAKTPHPPQPRVDEAVSLLPEVCDTLETLLAALADDRPDRAAEPPARFHRLLLHEVRNRVNLVNLSLAQWDLRCRQNGEIDEDGSFIEAARRALASLTELVGEPDLLVPTAPPRSGAEARPLPEVFEQVVAVSRPVAGERGAAVSVGGALPDRPVDPLRMELVLLNLVLNALDHVDPDKPERWVRLAAHDNGDGEMQVQVADNGVGMSPELAARVFDEGFRREDGEETGRGLGLSIVRRTVERWGGRVWLDSRPGAGTTVWLTVAAAPGAPEGPARA